TLFPYTTLFRSMKIDPIESVVSVIQLPQRRLIFVSIVQMLNQAVQTVVTRQFKELPVKLRVVVPFVRLAKFATHEKQLFAGVSVHPCQKHPEIGKLPPFVAWHFG